VTVTTVRGGLGREPARLGGSAGSGGHRPGGAMCERHRRGPYRVTLRIRWSASLPARVHGSADVRASDL